MSNKKILNNSFFLYIRLFITLSITLFTTRIVLNNLGLDDYGVYGAIGSIVALIILSLTFFFIQDSWKKEKADRIDREEKINNIYNEIMGKNEKEVENEK